MEIIDTFVNGYASYAGYLWHELTNPSWHNYFYWLLVVSGFFFALEWLSPWRKNQPRFRKDFWLDFFYMFVNFFLFSLVIYNAASDVVVKMFNGSIYALTNIDLKSLNPMHTWPLWAILLTGFVVRDFVQWWIHRLLHRVPCLWNFHKVHHSVEQMGFAAHLRYHWMENVVYRSIEYLPLALLGIGLHDFFIIHIFTLAVGHYNHSNISIDSKVTGTIVAVFIGILIVTPLIEVQYFKSAPVDIKVAMIAVCALCGYLGLSRIMKFLFNSPEMHIWHHAAEWPEKYPFGINFGLTLAIWDYIFGTASIPYDGRDVKLGFPDLEHFPKDFVSQEKYGLKNN
jgi:sterol desaturase/sphingolipid hydroxylase (fatty acid hydroxylase superfamily)